MRRAATSSQRLASWASRSGTSSLGVDPARRTRWSSRRPRRREPVQHRTQVRDQLLTRPRTVELDVGATGRLLSGRRDRHRSRSPGPSRGRPRAHAAGEVDRVHAVLASATRRRAPERAPERQTTTTSPVGAASASAETSGKRVGSSPMGMCRAPWTWPATHSSSSRTSRRVASGPTSAGPTLRNAAEHAVLRWGVCPGHPRTRRSRRPPLGPVRAARATGRAPAGRRRRCRRQGAAPVAASTAASARDERVEVAELGGVLAASAGQQPACSVAGSIRIQTSRTGGPPSSSTQRRPARGVPDLGGERCDEHDGAATGTDLAGGRRERRRTRAV